MSSPYCTPAQVRVVLTRNVAVPGGTAADLDDPTIQSRIDAAQTEVDITLASRYTVPFATVPPVITQITVGIAAYLATLVHQQSMGLEITQADPATQLYRWSHAQLGALADGKADIPELTNPDGSQTPAETRSVSVVNRYDGQLFGLDTWGLGCAPQGYATTRPYGYY